MSSLRIMITIVSILDFLIAVYMIFIEETDKAIYFMLMALGMLQLRGI